MPTSEKPPEIDCDSGCRGFNSRHPPQIQELKRDAEVSKQYLEMVNRDLHLKSTWKVLVVELKSRPLHNSSRDYDNPEIDGWWNNSSDARGSNQQKEGGIVRSLSDWENMVEFWYGVRNNLFHGGKDPNIKRDCFLVEHAFKTLNALMKSWIDRLRGVEV